MSEHLYQCSRHGFAMLQTSLRPGLSWAPLTAMALASTRFKTAGYLMADGGGFGATVPHLSSGG